MAVRRKARNPVTGWSWRLAGVALCAFFALGFLSGLGAPRTSFTLRTLNTLTSYRQKLLGAASMLRDWPLRQTRRAGNATFPGAVAMIERRDGFYALFAGGELRGPVPPGAEDNLPTISGGAIETARAQDLVEYASVLVRAEGQLSEMISEMRCGSDGEVSLFLDGSHTEIALDLDKAPAEIERAALVLRRWHGHESAIAALDMTTPAQAVMRIRTVTASAKGRVHPAKRAGRVAAHPVAAHLASPARLASADEARPR
ncbi:MAG: hypothetical protein WA005_17935 [Candidatus Binataceae bacterium]